VEHSGIEPLTSCMPETALATMCWLRSRAGEIKRNSRP